VKDPKTKPFSQALKALKVDGTALLVEQGANRNLELSARNLAGVEVVKGSEVHPYHLLRHDRAVFAQSAIEKLQASLKGSLSKRRAAAEVAQ
jgi:large subunit ribosomal protein L4